MHYRRCGWNLHGETWQAQGLTWCCRCCRAKENVKQERIYSRVCLIRGEGSMAHTHSYVLMHARDKKAGEPERTLRACPLKMFSKILRRIIFL